MLNIFSFIHFLPHLHFQSGNMMLCRTIQHVFSLWCVSYLALIEAETGYPFTLMSAQETPPATNSFISGPFTDNEGIGTVSICNRTDSSREAKCYADQFPQAYAASQAVIRIERLGRPHCTGWLVGDEGHIITNWHCIKTRADLYPLTFAAAAEGDTCDTDCQRPLGCSRDIYKNRLPVTFILTGGSLSKDYTLVQLHPQDRRLFLQASGYMKMRCAGPRKHEYVFIPQFPRGYGRRIAVASGNERARISALRAGNFNGCGYNQVGYVTR